MPKKIDSKVKERCVQQMLEHAQEYPNPTAAAVLSVASADDVGVVVGGDVLRAESGPADR